MKNVLRLDPGGETLHRQAVFGDMAEGTKSLPEDGDHCFVLCKKVGPNVFFIKSGLAFIDESKISLRPDALAVTCPTKIIFIPAKSKMGDL